MKLTKAVWGGLRARLEKTAFTILDCRIPVGKTEPPNLSALAYTDRKKIYLTENHPMLDGMTPQEVIFFAEGLFCHEVMHQAATDFNYHDLRMKKYPPCEQELLHELNNAMEDNAIEYLAPQFIGGHLLNALDYVRAVVYKNTPPIEENEDPFQQFFTALIQYGDQGILKGRFTDEKAKEIFIECLPYLDACVRETDGQERFRLSEEVFRLSRPLWQEIADMRAFLEKLREFASQIGRGEPGKGGGMPLLIPVPAEETSEADKNREITRRMLSVEKGEGKTEKGDSEDGKAEGEPGSDGSDPNEERKDPGGSPIEKGNPDTKEGPDAKGRDEGGEEKECPEEGPEKPDSGKEETAGPDSGPPSGPPPGQDSKIDYSGEPLPDEEEYASLAQRCEDYMISEDDIAEIERGIEKSRVEETELKKADAADKALTLDIPDISGKTFKSASCLNRVMRLSYPESVAAVYAACLKGLEGGIAAMTNQFRRLFRSDPAEKLHRAAGKLDVKRLSDGRVTSRVFTKRRDPNKTDTAVFIAVDESGSMSGSKIDYARETAIAFAETFGRLKIPLSIMGFTADTGADAVHDHFLHWRNGPGDRLKLTAIRAQANNFDGYSIRYASRLLQKRPELHKLLIVVSDGQPACQRYHGVDGIADTREAIREAGRKHAILGVAIGDQDTGIIKAMYGKNFLHVSNTAEMFPKIGKAVQNVIKGW